MRNRRLVFTSLFTFICLAVMLFSIGVASMNSGNTGGNKPAPTTNQDRELKKIPEMIHNVKSAGADFERRELFQSSNRSIPNDGQLREVLNDGIILDLDKPAIQRALRDGVEHLTLPLPDGRGGAIELELARVDIFAEGFSVKTSKPTSENIKESYGIHYRGIVKGNDRSLAAISIFKNEIAGFYSTEDEGNYVLGRLGGNNPNDRHILYAERDMKVHPDFSCHTEDPQGALPASAQQSADETGEAPAARCVKIYIEANYDLFQNKGSVANVTSYVTAFFNQSKTLYANDGIAVAISEIFVWNTPSSYSGTSSLQQLQQFKATRTTFNGDLAHLLTLQSSFGGIAYLDVLCVNRPFSYAFSGIDPTFNNVPTYSWTVMVFTHETGHNLGSPHTHACAWNGNNTAIDGCFTTEGGCANPGIPGGGGTIMSYCHLQSVGINLSLGFGPQPKTLITNKFNAATCLVDCGTVDPCGQSVPISSGQTLSGTLANTDCLVLSNYYTDNYTFSGTAGQQISINMNSAAVDAYLVLRGPAGTILMEDNNGGGGTNARIPATSGTFTLPSTGSYKFEASTNIALQQGAYSVTLNGGGPPAGRAVADFDGDGRTDVGVWRGTAGAWYLQQSTAGFSGVAFGTNGDKSVPSDFDGDGRTDIAVFRPASGTWYLLRSTLGFTGVNFGTNGDTPAPGDFDGDGIADVAVFRPSTGAWYVQRSSLGFFAMSFGANGDIPVVADYDGDNKADIAVYRPSTGAWYLQRSLLGFASYSFGAVGDKPAPGDFDHDLKADITVFRPGTGTWYVQRTAAGFLAFGFGANGDKPATGDYDGDGFADFAVFRPATGVWYLQRSTLGFTGVGFGANGDVPVAGAYVP
jgi:Reprolysin family propeptide./FG-GAP repeat./Reprolysin (M12B) family zinc metalloprotease.